MNRACQRWEKVGQYFLRFLHGGAVSFLWEAIYVIIITARSTPCGGSCGLRTALPLCGVLVLGAAHPLMRPAPLRVAGFGLRCRCAACSSSVLRTLDAARSTPCGGVAGFGFAVPLRGVLNPRCFAPFDAACPAAHGGQALRYVCAWLRASWLSAISGASRPSASLGGGLRTAVALRAVLVLGAAHP